MPVPSKSPVVASAGPPLARGGVVGARTRTALGSSSDRDAGVAGSPARCAGFTLAALAALAVLAACEPRVHGNGVYLEETRDLPAFGGIDIENGVAAVVTVDPALAQQSVRVIGDANVVDHIKTAVVDAEPAADVLGTAVKVVHVWVDVTHYVPIIPPVVVVTRSSFSLAQARDRSTVELRAPAGSPQGGPLGVVLDSGSVNAQQYPTAGAAVALQHGSTALLHSDGPVTGFVSDSHLDNTSGMGSCTVTTTGVVEVHCP